MVNCVRACRESRTIKPRLTDLVQKAKGGDRAAFDEIVHRFEPQVFAFCFKRLRNYHTARDLCQDVFLRAYVKLQQLTCPEAFAGWLWSIAGRLVINQAVRGARITLADPEVLETRLANTIGPEDAAIASEQRMLLTVALAQLSQMDQEVLIGFHVHGKTIKEMSDELRAPCGTIKRRLFVGRRRLAAKLDPGHCI